MARKVTERKKVAPAAEVPSAVSALLEIKPDVTLTIAGRQLTVREYGFFEGLEVAHQAQGLIRDMHAMCADGRLQYSRIRRLFGPHREVVIAIAAKAADVDADWVRGLEKSPQDAEVFFDTWFGVNASFFVHEVIVEMREARQLAAMASTGSQSSPVSPAPASATSTGSADSPSGS